MAQDNNVTRTDFKNKFQVISFNSAYIPPVLKYNKGRGLVEWGSKNDAPDLILQMYNTKGSPIHKSIIDRKVKMIAGYGFKTIQDEGLKQFIKANKLEKIIREIALDFELFDGFSLEVIWDKGGKKIVKVNYIPLHKLRFGIESDLVPYPYFWFSNKWSEYRKEEYTPIAIKRFDSIDNKGKQLYYHTNPNPESDGLYPIPSYSNSMNWISIAHAISEFHINSLKQGYFPSMVLAMNNGYPTDEEMDYFAKQLESNFAGQTNAGKIFITYAEGSDQAPKLIKVDLNDSDKRFSLLKEQVKEEIIEGHSIAPQLLLSTSGSLAGDTQREELKAEFQDLYVSARQNQIEEVLNDILAKAGFTEQVELLTYVGEAKEEVAVENVDKEAEARAALKGSVGGVQGILALQASVAQGITSLDSGAAILELIYGLEPSAARRMLGSPDTNNNIQPAA